MRAAVIPARREHVAAVAAGMRQADRDEAWAWAALGPEDALLASLRASALCWTGTLEGEPACMFGVAAPTLLSQEGEPWLLGTDALERIPTTFARLSREWLRRVAVFPVLGNWSDARHDRAHAWLAWLGFELGEARPGGALGLPFRPFAMEVARCAFH